MPRKFIMPSMNEGALGSRVMRSGARDLLDGGDRHAIFLAAKAKDNELLVRHGVSVRLLLRARIFERLFGNHAAHKFGPKQPVGREHRHKPLAVVKPADRRNLRVASPAREQRRRGID
jgi:hypothetical protein